MKKKKTFLLKYIHNEYIDNFSPFFERKTIYSKEIIKFILKEAHFSIWKIIFIIFYEYIIYIHMFPAIVPGQ